ncbi:hypothetical protein ZHAS_00016987 [Anopheles sinensis]|uniref:Uncharacterized protein n=1 Tax=Anopheles sinensis TaxID=74873 RepID=A0A084WFI8_ANOSI|nr:hypothetical protein ZHAS_00016987 [Anopheles sinensis]
MKEERGLPLTKTPRNHVLNDVENKGELINRTTKRCEQRNLEGSERANKPKRK